MARNISDLHPKAQELATKLVAECAKKGLIVKITDCLRNADEQEDCVNRGASSLYYPYSMHNWGVAFDFCRNDGKGAYNDSDGWFSKVGAIGRELGLMWGGDWTSPVDKPHFQLKDWGTGTSRLREKYGTPEKFRKTWGSVEIVETDGDFMVRTVKNGSTGNAVKVVQMVCGVAMDGKFGNQTRNAVMDLQKKYGLEVDGIVGSKTWSVIAQLL